MLDFPKSYRNKLKKTNFIDLFAGIGGFRYAMEYFGSSCVFTSEWEKFAQECYLKNFNDLPEGDITKISEKQIPSHDVICAGFPCQAFSVSGKRMGFKDTRGTLFFDVARIAKYHQPKTMILENVRNFQNHDNGKTLTTVINTLNDIGYNVYHKVLNSSLFGVPQRRLRIYIVAIRKDVDNNKFSFPKSFGDSTIIKDILDLKNDNSSMYIKRKDIDIYRNELVEKDIFENYPQKPFQIGRVNKGGQGERIYSIYGHGITQAATTGGPGGSTGLYFFDEGIRKLTPKESSRLNGFPEKFTPHPNKTQAWKQNGNSVVINVLQVIIKNQIDCGLYD